MIIIDPSFSVQYTPKSDELGTIEGGTINPPLAKLSVETSLPPRLLI